MMPILEENNPSPSMDLTATFPPLPLLMTEIAINLPWYACQVAYRLGH